MRLQFTKMHGIGNDFVILDAMRAAHPSPPTLRRIAARRLGVGCDQVLIAVPAADSKCAIGMRVFNADGSEAEQCGNGLRCFAVYAHAKGLVTSRRLFVETLAGPVEVCIEDNSAVSVDMGAPLLEPDAIPFVAARRTQRYPLEIDGTELAIGAVSMGNPHAVVAVADTAAAPVDCLGPSIQAHPRFPNGVNVGFMQVLTRERIRLRVYERGVGETPACGTGACAAVVVGHVQGVLDDAVDVDLPGGSLRVEWRGDGAPVWMTGATARVFDGEIDL